MKVLSCVLVAFALLGGSNAALADPRHDHGHDRDDHHDRDRGHWQNREHWRDGDRHGQWDRRYGDRGYYGGGQRWARGYRYEGPMVIVNDYSYYRLAPPPYGYRWVRADSGYLLVSIGDSMILDVVVR